MHYYAARFVRLVLDAGGAQANYAHSTRAYLLTYLQSSVEAQQAARWAYANVHPPSLRVYCGLYSDNLSQKQEAVDSVLNVLGNALRQRYSSMWDQNAMAVFVMKVRSRTCPLDMQWRTSMFFGMTVNTQLHQLHVVIL